MFTCLSVMPYRMTMASCTPCDYMTPNFKLKSVEDEC